MANSIKSEQIKELKFKKKIKKKEENFIMFEIYNLSNRNLISIKN